MPAPRVFVIGDSISLHYGPYLQAYLGVRARYARKGDGAPVSGALDYPEGGNGGDSRMVLAYLRELRRAAALNTDLLLLNCGLHDIKRDGADAPAQVPLPEYRDNLQRIVPLAREMARELLWVRTTPVEQALHIRVKPFHRYERDVLDYNAVADAVMRAEDVPTLDLYTFTTNLAEVPLTEDGVHFPEHIRALQAAYITGYLQRWLDSQLAQ